MFVYLVWEHQNSDCTSMFIKSSFNWCDRLFESCCSNLRTFRAGSLKDAMIFFVFFITQQIAIIMRLMHIDVTEPITNCHRHLDIFWMKYWNYPFPFGCEMIFGEGTHIQNDTTFHRAVFFLYRHQNQTHVCFMHLWIEQTLNARTGTYIE